MKLKNAKNSLILLIVVFSLLIFPKDSLAAGCSATDMGIWSLTCPPPPPPTNSCSSTGVTGTSIGGTTYTYCCCPATDQIIGDAYSTALGILSAKPGYLVKDILTLGLGVVGGITLLLFLAGTIRYTTSHGSPDGVAQAKSMITAALTGVAVIFLAVLLLGLLGVNVIGIPGWKFNGTQLETPN